MKSRRKKFTTMNDGKAKPESKKFAPLKARLALRKDGKKILPKVGSKTYGTKRVRKVY